MKWLGPLMEMIYAPRHDAHAVELAAILTRTRATTADMTATARRLEKRAAREPLDDLADGL